MHHSCPIRVDKGKADFVPEICVYMCSIRLTRQTYTNVLYVPFTATNLKYVLNTNLMTRKLRVPHIR